VLVADEPEFLCPYTKFPLLVNVKATVLGATFALRQISVQEFSIVANRLNKKNCARGIQITVQNNPPIKIDSVLRF
jgi:hypothetical protein